MKYEFNCEVYETEQEVQDAVREYAEDNFDNFIDEMYGEIEICGLSYYASNALKRVDEVAYRCGICDYEDMLQEDINEIEDDEDDEEVEE